MAKRTGDIELIGAVTAPDGAAATNVGEDISFTAGTGNTTGAGGAITITGGVGGNAADGGDITITGGGANANGGEPPIFGGDINITGGANVYAGEYAYGGAVNITGGNGGGTGGDVNITGGISTSTYDSGSVRITGGEGGNFSGEVEIRGGDGAASREPGGIQIYSGRTGIGGSFDAGTVGIYGGVGYEGYAGGNVSILGGSGNGAGGAGDGGYARIAGGNSGTTADGGQVQITGGNGGATSGDAGDIVITPGTAAGSGSDGAIVISQTAAPTVTTDKLYNVGGTLTWNGTDISTAGGDVTKVGTPVNNELAVWTGDGTLEGESELTFVGGALTVGITAGGELRSGTGQILSITPGSGGVGMNINGSFNAAGTGGLTTVSGGTSGNADGGNLVLQGGAPAASGDGGDVTINGRDGGATSGDGGSVLITSGTGSDQGDGGNITLTPGSGAGAGTDGIVNFVGQTSALDVSGDITLNDSGFGGVISNPTDRIFNFQSGDAAESAMRFQSSGAVTFGHIYGNASDFGIYDDSLVAAVTVSSSGSVTIRDSGTGRIATDGQGINVTGEMDITSHVNLGALSDLVFTEKADHTSTPTAGFGYLWTRNDSPNTLIFTDDAGTDHDLTAAGGGNNLSVTTVTGTSFTAAAWDAVMVDDDTAGSTVTITLPAGSTDDQIVVKKLGTTANVIVDGDASETIDGATTFTLTAQYASVSLIWNGSEWSII